MSESEILNDLSDDEIDTAIENPRKMVTEATACMAREIKRRRAANRDLEAVKAGMLADIEATPEIKAALVKEMATYRLMASMGVRDLRWDEQAITQVCEKLSPEARAAYERNEKADAAHLAFNAAYSRRMRGRLGITSETLLALVNQEREIMSELAHATLAYFEHVTPELVALVEARQRTFDAAVAKETQAPLGGGSGVSAEALRQTSAAAAAPKVVRTKITLTNISLHDSKDSPSADFVGPREIKIGKMSSNDVTVFGEYVARLHAVIDLKHDGVVQICDMGSPFGTFVNDKPIRLQTLVSGDVITIGNAAKYRVTFQVMP